MIQTLGHVALVVRNYDEALAFFTRKLDFAVVEDTRLSEDKRWVLIAPPGSEGTTVLLARAATPEQESRIGNQTADEFFFFCTPPISGVITTRCLSVESGSCAIRKRRRMARSRCSRISTAIFGT
jgi:catechol 2,3-dioxygenase-like lactoylglutathione lyase family enzyme